MLQGQLAQLVRARDSHSRGHRFESCIAHHQIMKKQSAGILVYRNKNGQIEVLLGHHGSPLWSSKDLGAWTIPKGTYDNNESMIDAAKREFTEETGFPVPKGELKEIGSVEQKNNKVVSVWAIKANLDASKAFSNTFKTEWPPRSGKVQEFPELDRFGWFALPEAAKKINPHQVPFLERLSKNLGIEPVLEDESPSQSTLL